MKYTPEITEHITAQYKASPTRATVDELASLYDVSPRSIIGKLSKLGIYRADRYIPKYGPAVISKTEMVRHLEHALDTELPGLEKSQKPALISLVKRLAELSVIPEIEDD